MDQVLIALDAAWKVLVACILLGSGLPALYTVGLRQLALANGGMAAAPTRTTHPGLHRAVAYTLFTIVVLAIVLGLSYIVAHGFGYSITFDGILPHIKKK